MFESIGNFFKGLFSATTTFNNIFGFFMSHLPFLLIGAFVALMIILIIATVTHKIPNVLLCVLLAIVCIGASFGVAALIDSLNGSKNKEIDTNDVNTYNEELNIKINSVYQNKNGNLNYNQILTSQNDENCPTVEDIVIDLYVKDFGNYVNFYYQDENEIYHNAVFVKDGDSLIYDGVLNTSCGFRGQVYPWFTWFSLGILRNYNLESFEWETEYNKVPYYNTKARKAGMGVFTGTYDNLITETRRLDYNYTFNNFQWNFLNRNDAKRKIDKNTQELIANNTTYFQKFGDVELVNIIESESENCRSVYNSFYSYLWNQLEDVENGDFKIINSSKQLCKPIPEELQTSYPISNATKQNHPEYANLNYYGVYNCNISVKLHKVGETSKVKLSKTAGGILTILSPKECYGIKTYDRLKNLSVAVIPTVTTYRGNEGNVHALISNNSNVNITIKYGPTEDNLKFEQIIPKNTNGSIIHPVILEDMFLSEPGTLDIYYKITAYGYNTITGQTYVTINESN